MPSYFTAHCSYSLACNVDVEFLLEPPHLLRSRAVTAQRLPLPLGRSLFTAHCSLFMQHICILCKKEVCAGCGPEKHLHALIRAALRPTPARSWMCGRCKQGALPEMEDLDIIDLLGEGSGE